MIHDLYITLCTQHPNIGKNLKVRQPGIMKNFPGKLLILQFPLPHTLIITLVSQNYFED